LIRLNGVRNGNSSVGVVWSEINQKVADQMAQLAFYWQPSGKI
jgi:hypothetical protein